MQGDPMDLILKLQQKYREYGAVKIRTCAEWNPSFNFKYTEKPITTRIQKIHRLNQGKVTFPHWPVIKQLVYLSHFPSLYRLSTKKNKNTASNPLPNMLTISKRNTSSSTKSLAPLAKQRWNMNTGTWSKALLSKVRSCKISTKWQSNTLLTYLPIILALAFLSSSPLVPLTKTSTMLPLFSTLTTLINQPSPSSACPIATTKRSAESQSHGSIWACSFLPSAGMSKIYGSIPSITAIRAPPRRGMWFLRAIRTNLMPTSFRKQESENF